MGWIEMKWSRLKWVWRCRIHDIMGRLKKRSER